MQNGGSRAASGGGGAKTLNIRGVWAADSFLFAPNRMQIGADLRHRVFEGSLKCVVEARSPQIVGLRNAVNSGGVEQLDRILIKTTLNSSKT